MTTTSLGHECDCKRQERGIESNVPILVLSAQGCCWVWENTHNTGKSAALLGKWLRRCDDEVHGEHIELKSPDPCSSQAPIKLSSLKRTDRWFTWAQNKTIELRSNARLSTEVGQTTTAAARLARVRGAFQSTTGKCQSCRNSLTNIDKERKRRRVIYIRHAIKNGSTRRQTEGGVVAGSPVVTEGFFQGSIVYCLHMSANNECRPPRRISTKVKETFLPETREEVQCMNCVTLTESYTEHSNYEPFASFT